MLPHLEIEAPPELAAVRMRLQAISPGRFGDIAEFLGIAEAGSAIRVILAPEIHFAEAQFHFDELYGALISEL